MKLGKASNPGEPRECRAGQSRGRTAFLQGTTRKTQLPELGFGSSTCWGAGHLLSWQSCPVNPGWQEQVPVAGSQSPPSQAQELAQPWPQWPLLQAAKGNRVTSSTTPNPAALPRDTTQNTQHGTRLSSQLQRRHELWK